MPSTPSLSQQTREHVTNNSQFIRQRDTLTEMGGSEEAPNSGNQTWRGDETIDTYHHVIGSEDAYKYGGDYEEPEVVKRPVANATLKVTHRGASGSTQYRPQGDDYPAKNFDYRARQLAEFEGEIPGQGKLFIHESSHPTSTVEYMMSTKGGRVANMTQLGIAARDTMQRHGRELRPSDDLSQHSSRLVEKLESRGIVKNRKQLSNTLNFESKPFGVSPDWGYGANGRTNALSQGQFELVPDADVQAGRQHVRDVFGGSKKRSDGEQLRMFE